MNNTTNSKQLRAALKSGDLDRIREVSQPGTERVTVFWNEIEPGLYQHKETGELRVESTFKNDDKGPLAGVHFLVKRFRSDGTPSNSNT